jgi:hypothetical protein
MAGTTNIGRIRNAVFRRFLGATGIIGAFSYFSCPFVPSVFFYRLFVKLIHKLQKVHFGKLSADL